VLDILSRVLLPDSSVADAVAKALLNKDFPERAYRQPSVSDEFLINALRNKKLAAKYTEIIVARGLSKPVREVFLQRKDKRVGVNSAFLHYNSLTSSEVEQYRAYAPNNPLYTILNTQPHAFSYTEFRDIILSNSVLGSVALGFLNYDEFEAQDLVDLMYKNRFDLSTMTPVKELVAVNFEVLEKLFDLTSLQLSSAEQSVTQSAIDRAYISALSSAWFPSQSVAEFHLQHAVKMLPLLDHVYMEPVLRSLYGACLNPRVSNKQAYSLLDIIESKNAARIDVTTTREVRAYRQKVESLGFNVFYGSYETLPEEFHAGLYTLFLARKAHLSYGAQSTAVFLQVMRAPGFSDKEKIDLFIGFKDLFPGIIYPFIEKQLLPSVSSDLRDYLFICDPVDVSVRPNRWFVPFEEHTWVRVACEKFGTDVSAWETFILLYIAGKNGPTEQTCLDLIQAACKLNYA